LGSERLDDLFQAVGESKQPITSVKSYLKDLNMNASNQTGLKNKQTNKKKTGGKNTQQHFWETRQGHHQKKKKEITDEYL
jgi:uncharacterized protein YoxC